MVKSVPEPAGKHDALGPEGGGVLPSSPAPEPLLELDDVLDPLEPPPDVAPDDAPDPLPGSPGDELGYDPDDPPPDPAPPASDPRPFALLPPP